MKIGLFIPCFINELYPNVALDTLKILESFNLDIEYPMEQTCCGQPQANTGLRDEAATLAKRFLNIFKKYDYIVAPSGSCVSMVRDNYEQFLEGIDGFSHIKTHTYELIEFIHDIIQPKSLHVSFPYKVSIHNSCHAHRNLHLATPSERNIPYYSKIKNILSMVDNLTLVEPSRVDECCGFGGTFAITEEAISVAMGEAKVKDHLQTGAKFITGVDMSCLMHMQGVIDRHKFPIETIHIAEILAKGLK